MTVTGTQASAAPIETSDGVALRLVDVVKSFPGVLALKGVTFEVRRGEVHALVGENGAGKSTLMAIAAGSLLPDSGIVEIGGVEMHDPSPLAAQELGLRVVYQHPALLPDLTVAENMAYAAPLRARPKMGNAVRWAREHLAAVDADVDPRRRVVELTVAERHLVEIAKAISTDPRILILDEPTEPLLADEIERLFDKVRTIAKNGTAVVYISHRIPEVRSIADRVTALRDGQTRGTFDIDDVTEQDIVRLIVGRDVDAAFPPKHLTTELASSLPALELADFSGSPDFEGVSLSVQPGEIVGLAGIAGNGQQDFIRALAGLHPSSGEIRVGGRPVTLRRPESASHAGIRYMPGDRHDEGLFLSLSVRENAAVSALPSYARGGVVRSRTEAAHVREQITKLAIRTPSMETPVASLSGGNQQKVVLARALLSAPRVLLADEPTQGVDVGARLEIYRILRQAAENGAAVVVLSSDGVELQGLCDRVLIFSRGHVVKELDGDDVTEGAIAEAALMSTHLRARSEPQTGTSGQIGRFLRGDYAPSLVLAVAMLLLGIYTASQSDFFLTGRNISGLLFLLSALVFIGFGQLVVMMTGGIDLSVGPLTGLLVVVASFFVTAGGGFGGLVAGVLAMIVVAAAVGFTNGGFVRWLRMPPVVATLVTYIVLQGVARLLRDTPDGSIDDAVITAIGRTVGPIPIAFLVAVGLGIALELALRRTRWGLNLRAVGSKDDAAHVLGANVARTRMLAYVGCSLLTFLGALMLMAQVGIGDASAGQAYTLSSITAVVLGGASIFGGRGSFIGVIFGAALVQQIVNATTFLELGQAWQYWLVGGVTIVAAGFYSKARSVRQRRAAGRA
ncbi:MAG: ATP-binding cassette domain-containing protein [Solirubrobacteraceae bacterium]